MAPSGYFRGRYLVAAALVLVAVAGIRHLWLVDDARPVRSGEPLRTLHVRALDGSAVSLSAAPGHWMLINVYASWCTPCRQEFPDLSRAAPALAARGVDVVGIDQAEPVGSVEAVSNAFGLHYPMYIDDDLVTQHVLGAHVIPETIVVDPGGRVRAIHVGPLNQSEFVALAAGKSVL